MTDTLRERALKACRECFDVFCSTARDEANFATIRAAIEALPTEKEQLAIGSHRVSLCECTCDACHDASTVTAYLTRLAQAEKETA